MIIKANIGTLNFVNDIDYQFHKQKNQFNNAKTGILIAANNQFPSFNLVIERFTAEDLVCKIISCQDLTETDITLSDFADVNNDKFVIRNDMYGGGGEIREYTEQTSPEWSIPYQQIVSTGTAGSGLTLANGLYYFKFTDSYGSIFSNIFRVKNFVSVTNEILLATDGEALETGDNELLITA